jgi:hypothetical protein
LVLISACSTPHPDHSKTILKLDLNDSKGDKLSDLFGSISYRLLDTGDDNYLAMPGKLTLSNKLIWVRDSRLSNILVFEEDGQLKTAIKASLNPGPGEFLQSEDFQVFEDRLKIRDYPHTNFEPRFSRQYIFLNKMYLFDISEATAADQFELGNYL